MAGTVQELFEHGLTDMYDAEQKLVRALRRMAKNAKNRELSRGFSGHARTTARQAKRLEQIFRAVGRKPKRHPCAGIDGLIEEYATFVRDERPEASVLDVFASEAALKVEHYEIVAYNGLIDLGKQLQLGNEVKLLRETLQEEEQTAQSLERLSKSLGQAMPNGEEPTAERRGRKARKKR
jgi:ferritin-like metal-binding protein YciE